MRNKVFGGAALLAATLVSVSATAGQDRPLAEIYKTRRVRLIEEVRVADAALPADALFQNPTGWPGTPITKPMSGFRFPIIPQSPWRSCLPARSSQA